VIVVHKELIRTPSSILTLLRLTLFRVIELFVPKNVYVQTSLLKELTDESDKTACVFSVAQTSLVICFISLDHRGFTSIETAI